MGEVDSYSKATSEEEGYLRKKVVGERKERARELGGEKVEESYEARRRPKQRTTKHQGVGNHPLS